MDHKGGANTTDKGEYYVYGLYYPETMGGRCFYIGKGSGKRIYRHEAEARGRFKESNPYKCNVIRKIWAHDEKVVKTKLAHFSDEKDAFLYETALIFLMGGLTNLTEGGEGMSGFTPSEETRRKMSEAAKLRGGFPEEAHRKAREANIGRKMSEEARHKLSESRKGKPMPEAQRQHLREVTKGKFPLEEHIRKSAEARKGKKRPPFSEEHRRKISEAHKGKPLSQPRSEEYRRKMSKAKKGNKFSEEHRRKLSEFAQVRNRTRMRDANGRFIS